MIKVVILISKADYLAKVELIFMQPVIDPSLPLLSSPEIRRLMEDLEEANIEKDNLMQKCHNLEKKVNLLQEEKSNVITEYEILQKEVMLIFKNVFLKLSKKIQMINFNHAG